MNEGIIHVHANDNGKLSESSSAKIWVYSDGSSKVEKIGALKHSELKEIQEWIFNNIDIIEDEWFRNKMGGTFKRK